MIYYVKRQDLSVEKYDACIEKSINSRIYAFSWYLDIVADNWDALILNDYEAVMPLPWRSKYFIKYVYPPAWTQQLGIFSSKEISEDLVGNFIKTIPKKFKKITIQFNSGNKIIGKNITEKVNYVLPLDRPYEELFMNFRNNRKRVLNKAIGLGYIVDKEIKENEFLELLVNTNKNYILNQNQKYTLKNLLNIKNESIQIWGIRKNKKLSTCLLLLKNEKRIAYLLPIATMDAKKNGLPTILIAEILQQYANTKLLIDFEGSMIKGVADFYKSFGAEKERYFLFEMPF